jgi:hypothetical protein
MKEDQLRLAAGAAVGAALLLGARRAFAQATLDNLATQLNDLIFLGVSTLALLVLLIGLGAAIYGRQR